jgi:hypothetical protein
LQGTSGNEFKQPPSTLGPEAPSLGPSVQATCKIHCKSDCRMLHLGLAFDISRQGLQTHEHQYIKARHSKEIGNKPPISEFRVIETSLKRNLYNNFDSRTHQ